MRKEIGKLGFECASIVERTTIECFFEAKEYIDEATAE